MGEFFLSLNSGRHSFPKSWGDLYLALQSSALCILALVMKKEMGEPRPDRDDRRSIGQAMSQTLRKKAKARSFISGELGFLGVRMEFEPPSSSGTGEYKRL